MSALAVIHSYGGDLPEELILDLDANKGIAVEDGNRVLKWINQISTSKAKDFIKQDTGQEIPGAGCPTFKKSEAAIGGNNTLMFRRQELINHNEDVFDHLITGSGHTRFAVLRVYDQIVQVKDLNSFFGNLRNGLSFGRWDKNNPMIAEKGV